jgi:hypothetical protein
MISLAASRAMHDAMRVPEYWPAAKLAASYRARGLHLSRERREDR